MRVFVCIVLGSALTLSAATPALSAVQPFPPIPGGPSVDPPTAACFELPYFGPKGHADFDFGDEIIRLLDERGVRIEGIAPMEAEPGDKGVHMPIGWQQDHVGPCRGVYTPAGFTLIDDRSGHVVAVHDVHLRADGAHAQVEIDGQEQGEQLVATYKLHEFAWNVPTPRPLEGGIAPSTGPSTSAPTSWTRSGSSTCRGAGATVRAMAALL